MTQLTLLELELKPAPVDPWQRFGSELGKLGTWWLHENGCEIHHCGHPTANFPLYIVTPAGDRILDKNGRGFRHIADAKQAAEAWRP
jgi:hypothetical protein